jgi:hypothetical protein
VHYIVEHSRNGMNLDGMGFYVKNLYRIICKPWQDCWKIVEEIIMVGYRKMEDGRDLERMRWNSMYLLLWNIKFSLFIQFFYLAQ